MNAPINPVVKFIISPDMVGKVIGKGGSNIRNMRMNSGARIHLDSETKEVSISGTQEQQQVAFVLVTNCLHEQ
jgi:polyribonucleotide nucleotidyltransferase